MILIFEIPDPQFTYYFATYSSLRRRLGHVIGENSVYPIVNATKFTAHAQYPRDLCTGGPPKPHVTIFDPELPINYTTFMGLR